MSYEERVSLLKNRPKSKKVGVICVIDKSGSMESLQSETIQMFNDFLKSQQRIKDNAEMSVLLFDTFVTRHAWKERVEDVSPLTTSTYHPDGFTALYDAVGKALSETDYDKCIMVIITDGEENSSNYYSSKRIKEMIKEREEQGWKFEYLGVGLENFQEEALHMGITYSVGYAHTSEGLRSAYSATAMSVSDYVDLVTNTNAQESKTS